MWSTILTVTHLIGLVNAVGAATVKLGLLLQCGGDPAFLPVYTRVSKLITRHIIIGLALMTLSGIGWLAGGYPFTPRLIVKVLLVAAIWVMGPIIDNVVEPRFLALAPAAGEPASPAFVVARKRYLALEVVATLLFYVIVIMWVMR